MRLIFKFLLSVLLVLAILAGIGFRPEPQRGAVLAVHDGVPIFHQSGADVRGKFGLEFECVEFVNRWLVSHGFKNLTRTGDARSYFDQAAAKGLVPYPNGRLEPPKWGDVIVFSSSVQPAGHVGIVVAVNNRSIWIAQQNATIRLGPFVRPLPYERLPLRQKNGGWVVYSRPPLTCLGWARPR